MPSINEGIDSDDFPCEWGTFLEVLLLVMDALPGSKGATLDVDMVFHRVPIIPEQQPAFVVGWEDKFYIDHTGPFGPSSSPGIFGRLADTLVAVYKARGISPIKKWVDDFLFLRYLLENSPPERPCFNYDLEIIVDIANDLGWPWKESKTHPFAPTFTYLGFLWNLKAHLVEIPIEKHNRFLMKLEPWTLGFKSTRKEAESLLGMLVHCSLALPESHSRLPALSRFMSDFSNAKSPFSRFAIPSTVLADTVWWRHILMFSNCHTMLHRPPEPQDILFTVDAATSYGIGVVFGCHWESWKLLPGWNSHGRDIGWGEMVAIELGL